MGLLSFSKLFLIIAWFRAQGLEVVVAASPPKKEANPASLRSAAPSIGRGSRGHSLLPMEGGAPKGRRLDGDGGMKKSEEDRLKYAINESTLSTAVRSPFPNGEGNDTRMPLFSTQRLSRWGRQRGAKKKANPASLRPLPLPREGARVDTPSLLWKEVPRRGG